MSDFLEWPYSSVPGKLKRKTQHVTQINMKISEVASPTSWLLTSSPEAHLRLPRDEPGTQVLGNSPGERWAFRVLSSQWEHGFLQLKYPSASIGSFQVILFQFANQSDSRWAKLWKHRLALPSTFQDSWALLEKQRMESFLPRSSWSLLRIWWRFESFPSADTHTFNILHLFQVHRLPEAHKEWFRRSPG